MASPKLHNTFRQYHRWVGFFLAGIMGIYALSGILLIYRPTGLLKFDYVIEKQLSPDLKAPAVGKKLGIRRFAVTEQDTQTITFKNGQYNKGTGVAVYTKKDYPFPLNKFVTLHKASTNSPLYILNITFGAALLFFVISAFLMFMPRALVYKNGLKIALGGFLFTALVVMFGS